MSVITLNSILKLVNFRVAVRVGEFDFTKEVDCEDCSSAVEIKIEKFIVHPEFISSAAYKGNDIALLRLSEAVQISKSVRNIGTICLPLEKLNQLDTSTNINMTVMGFGRTELENFSNVLLKTEVPFVSNKECNKIYGELEGVGELHPGQMCAGGGKSDSCKGKIIQNLIFEPRKLFHCI